MAKYYEWSPAKSDQLKETRGLGFEEVVSAINESGLLAVEKHHNQSDYPGQKMYIVKIQEYVFMVPFVEDKDKYFLKTIFPSRKMTKKYLIDRRKK